MDDLVLTQGDEMIGAFDFSMIDSEAEAVEEAVEEVEQEEVEVEAEEVETEDEEAEEEAEAEEVEEEAEVEDDTEEAIEEVDYENWEIALPSGEEVKLAQLVQGFKDATALEQERNAFEAVKTEFESKSQHIGSLMEMALLESQQAVDSYADYDWGKVAKEDPAEYAEHREYFEHHRRRVKDVQNAYNEIKQKEAAEVKAAEEAKVQEANAILVREIPGWNGDMYNNLMRYAVDSGFDEDYVLASISPAFFKMLHKNMSIEKGVQKVTAKVKKVGAPKKVIKNTASKPKVSEEGKKQALLKKAEKTGDMSLMFSLLED